MISAHPCPRKAEGVPNSEGLVPHRVGVVQGVALHEAANSCAAGASLATRNLHDTTQHVERAEGVVSLEAELGLPDVLAGRASLQNHIHRHDNERVRALAVPAPEKRTACDVLEDIPQKLSLVIA